MTNTNKNIRIKTIQSGMCVPLMNSLSKYTPRVCRFFYIFTYVCHIVNARLAKHAKGNELSKLHQPSFSVLKKVFNFLYRRKCLENI